MTYECDECGEPCVLFDDSPLPGFGREVEWWCDHCETSWYEIVTDEEEGGPA